MTEIIEPGQSRHVSDLARFRQMRPSKCTAWIEANLNFPHEDWCLIWPFSRKGGGYVSVGPRQLAEQTGWSERMIRETAKA